MESTAAKTRFWRVPELDGMEVLWGRYSVSDHFPRHMHEEYVVSVMTDGAEILRHRGTSHTAPAGSVLLINPGEWHVNHAQGPAGYAYFTLYPTITLLREFVGKVTGSDGDAPLFASSPVVYNAPPLRQALLALHRSVENRASALEKEARFLDCTAQLLCAHTTTTPVDLSSPSPDAGPRPVRVVRDFLEAAAPDRNVSLSELAALVDLSPFHLLRLFRDQVGLPPHEYVTHLRVARARDLLRAGCPLAQVAAAVGFADQSHLNRHFRRIVGVTPGRFAAGTDSGPQ
jgi:AraC-like DNA-binding protein